MEPVASLANRVLEREVWARERLTAHAGRMFVVAVGPVATAFRVGGTGLIESTTLSGNAPDLTLRFSPLIIASFLADPSRWDALVVAEGDPALAATLRELSLTLPWFVEQALAGALGPIVGQRLADVGRRLFRAQEYAAQRVAESMGSYPRDEAGLLARGEEGRSFEHETAALATRVDALAARIAAVETRLATSAAQAGPVRLARRPDVPAPVVPSSPRH